MNNNLYLGCHLSSTKGFLAMGKAAVSIGANTFAFFTRNPRGGKSKNIDIDDVNKLKVFMRENKFGPLVAHAPYTLNPCSKDLKVRDFAYLAMKEDLEKMEFLPNNYYNFHPGSHVGQGIEEGIKLISDLLNNILTKEQNTTVLLETMAGKGSEVGGRFEEIASIIEKVELKDKIGVCLDTCHVNDAGYDIISELDEVFVEFDNIIGLDKLKAFHINDSKNELGAHKDRHECIGYGKIGLDPIVSFLKHKHVIGKPCILETPQDDLSGYASEINMLKSHVTNN